MEVKKKKMAVSSFTGGYLDIIKRMCRMRTKFGKHSRSHSKSGFYRWCMEVKKKEMAASLSKQKFTKYGVDGRKPSTSRDESGSHQLSMKAKKKKMTASSSKKKSTEHGADGENSSTTQGESSDTDSAVPETQCAICLKDKEDEVYLDNCEHTFCFTCIKKWSNCQRFCPICKTPHTTILHRVKRVKNPCRHPVKPMEEDLPDYEIEARKSLLAKQKHDKLVSDIIRKDTLLRSYINIRRKVYLEDLFAVETYPETVVNEEYFVENPGDYERVLTWMHRELNAIYLHCEFVPKTAYRGFVSTIMKEPLMSKMFQFIVRKALGKLSRHFQHELACFTASKLSIEDYSEVVTYIPIHINRDKYKNESRWRYSSKLDAVDILVFFAFKQFFFVDEGKDKFLFSNSDGSEDESNAEKEFDNAVQPTILCRMFFN